MTEAERPLRPGSAFAVALLAALGAGAAMIRGLVGIEEPSAPVLFAVPGSAVVLVLAVTAGRLSLRPRLRVFAAAPFLGFLLAAAAHVALILPLSMFYVPARDLLDILLGAPNLEHLDARLLVVLLLTAGAIAPLTEEVAKAIPAGFARAHSRGGAFLAGVTAGAGFGIVEHALYSLPAAGYEEAWVQVMMLRGISAAMHPLATGFVFLGWWECRRTGARQPLVRGFALAVGLHAAWNVTAVVIEGVATAAGDDLPVALEAAGLVYAGLVGIGIGGLLWRTITAVEAHSGEDPTGALRPGRRVWAALALALALPLALLPGILPRL